MKDAKRVIINGKRWYLKTLRKNAKRKTYGTCDHPETPHKTIEVEVQHDDQLDLDILLHECLHARFPDLKEETVNQFAIDIAKIVTNQGWQRK